MVYQTSEKHCFVCFFNFYIQVKCDIDIDFVKMNNFQYFCLCLLGNFACFLVVCGFLTFPSQNIISGILLEFQTVSVQFRSAYVLGHIRVGSVGGSIHVRCSTHREQVSFVNPLLSFSCSASTTSAVPLV